MTFPQPDPAPDQPSQPPFAPQFPPGAEQPAYGTQPTYAAQPGQPYPGYGYPYPPYNPAAQTNTMAILSLVLAFVFAPLGAVFGHIARKQIRERGEGGAGLATAGLILGYVFTGLYVLYCAGMIVFFVAIANENS